MQLTDLLQGGTIAWAIGGLVALLVGGGVIAFTFWYTSDDQTEI